MFIISSQDIKHCLPPPSLGFGCGVAVSDPVLIQSVNVYYVLSFVCDYTRFSRISRETQRVMRSPSIV